MDCKCQLFPFLESSTIIKTRRENKLYPYVVIFTLAKFLLFMKSEGIKIPRLIDKLIHILIDVCVNNINMK